VLVSIDTLRADHLPAYGYKGVATPALDALARDAIVFDNAYSPVPLTLPAHASLLSGQLPPAHGVRDNLGYVFDAARHATLQSLLKARGYATGAAVSAYVLHHSTGIAAGFDFYDDKVDTSAAGHAVGQAQRSGAESARGALEWLAGVGSRPPFLFLHLYEPHSPYDPPEPYRTRYATLPYDGEIAAADAILGSVVEALKQKGLYDRAIVVVLSDHGEGLNEHGEEYHGILLYREALHVPLLVKLPGAARAGERVSRPVGLVDVMPTIAALVGAAVPPGLPGRPLLDAAPGTAGVYSETFYPRIHLGWSELRSWIDARYHYIDGPRPELFDIASDPGEHTNLLATDPGRAAPLRDALGRMQGSFAGPGAVSAEQSERLAALGYIAGNAAVHAGPLPDPRDKLPVLADVQAAFRMGAAGRDEEAAVLLRRVLAGSPGFFDVQYQLAETLTRLGRDAEAYTTYRAALQSNPALAGPTGLALARVCLRLGRYDEAAANARLGLETQPARSHELLARVALGRDRLDEAEREALLVSDDVAAEGGAAVVRAELRIRRNQPAAALEILDAMRARLAKGDAVRDLAFLRGDVLARLERFPEAQAEFQAEIASFPDNAQAYARLAIVLAIQGRPARDVRGVLDRLVAHNRSREAAELAAKTMESMGDGTSAAAYRRGAGRAR
jgi:arylsulfatase A-like enzyme/tetratricopeptide (TPR) repeat protein